MQLRLRSPASLVGALCLFAATNASAALSGTFNASDTTTGNTVVTGLTSGPFTVGVSGPGFCAGPPNTCGSGAGLSDNTSVSATSVTFNFSGSTSGAGPGSFTIDLSNFTSVITGVTLTSGGLGGATVTESFTAHSVSFDFSTASDYNAIGGETAVFTVTSAAVPEPSSVVLLITLLAGAMVVGRRRLFGNGGSEA